MTTKVTRITIDTYIDKSNKITANQLTEQIDSYPVNTYLKLCIKGNINDISKYVYGKVKTTDGWISYSTIIGKVPDSLMSDEEVLDFVKKNNIKNIGVNTPKNII